MEDRPDPRVEDLLGHWQAQTRHHALLFLDPTGERIVGAAGGVGPVLGYAAEELVGMAVAELFTPEDRALGLDRHEVMIAAQAGDGSDDRWHLRKDGSRVWISGTLTALHDAAGRVVGFAKLMRDRTDLRVQIEKLQNRVAALSDADQQREVFLATLAHELRNPLMPLANAARLIRMGCAGDSMRFPLQVIDRQLALLTRLVDDMMDVTRIDVGKLELKIEEIEVQAAIAQAVELARPAAQTRGLHLSALQPSVPIVIQADPSRFEQIVVNLLNNAIKYTPAGGHVWVKVTVETEQAVIRVEDDGQGIAAEMLPRIFELFTQESGVGAAASGGLGIGLALVKSLVEQHHGVVEVRSDGRNRGSEFTVRLPLRQPRVASPP